MAAQAKHAKSAKLAVGLIGPGLIGGALLDQIHKQAPVLLSGQNVDIEVQGITSSRKMLVNGSGVPLGSWREEYEMQASQADLEAFAQQLSACAAAAGRQPVLVDCTASEVPAEHYASWLGSGIHLVTPNKKLNSGPLARYHAALAAAAASRAIYLSEGTVGAGLPVISTLSTLVDTGDRLLRVEGVLSGTLSYIFNTFGPGQNFSEVVAGAKANGYTEPDPRDDLNGTDVARKVLTLARVGGAAFELSDVEVESLVAEPLRACASGDEYMARLPEFDAEMTARAAEADAAGEVLRYVGTYDGATGKCSAALRRFPKGHPFSQLSGADNMLVFTTERYNSQPLIVRGPGAGSEVTAAGVFGDIVTLAKRVAS